MAEEFYKRLERLLAARGVRHEDAASAMGAGIDTVRRLLDGRTKQAKLDEALRLCDRYDIDPWELAFGRPRNREADYAVTLPDGTTVAIDLKVSRRAPGGTDEIAAIENAAVEAIAKSLGGGISRHRRLAEAGVSLLPSSGRPRAQNQTPDLRGLVEEAVAAAVTPLAERLQMLQAEVQRLALARAAAAKVETGAPPKAAAKNRSRRQPAGK